jgi:hypothetical protein
MLNLSLNLNLVRHGEVTMGREEVHESGWDARFAGVGAILTLSGFKTTARDE